ncbi:MAG: hypothetical protein ABL903_20620 [Methylococcales bacterium]
MGNILADQNIILKTTPNILVGRAIALNGSVTMDSNTISNGDVSLIPVPATHTAAAENIAYEIAKI